MTGRIEIAPVDKGVSRLTVSGMYEPPLGKLGRQLDETVMNGIAEATVRELAESIAKRIEAAASRSEKQKRPEPGGPFGPLTAPARRLD